MALKNFRPLTPSNRFKSLPAFSEITKDQPEKSLTAVRKRTGGRNNAGRMTMRHRGGGHKRKYRLVDFKRKKQGVVAEVLAIEYDPNRSARIALLQYSDGEKAYILAPVGLAVGAKVNAGETADPSIGNALPLKAIPLGTAIHNVEIIPGRGAQMVRSAGSQATLANREGGYALIKLASGEMRRINEECYATIGQVGNTDHMNVSSGKAGRTRWLGRRPHVRGMVMNPIDHPMGGGQGKSKGGGGRHHPMSPWGQLAKGYKTRRKHKPSDRFIIQRRKGKVQN
jgi:large subunit ribosomal protein L2